jgi:putative transposase
MSGEFEVRGMCGVLGMSRSAYYEWRCKTTPPVDEAREVLKARIRRLFLESRCSYGFRSIRKDLGKEGIHVGKKRIRRLMREMALVASPVLPRPYGAAQVAEESRVCKHRLKRNFLVKRPNRVWVGDITYIWTHQGWVYLAVVLDLFSRKVVGWALSRKPDTSLVIDALAKAVRSRAYRRWRLMFHSDQGCQYTSKEFRQYLSDRGILQSMSRRGQCWDNAVSESFFSSLKRETGIRCWLLENMEELNEAIFDWIEPWYNRKRRHSTLDYCSPVEFEIIKEAA